MKKLLVAAFVFAAVSGSVALADRRNPAQERLPIDTLNGQGFLSGDVFTFSPTVANTRQQEIICSLFATGTAKKTGTTTTVDVTKFVKGMYIEVDQENRVNFQFRDANFGNGYKLSRSSVKAHASCQDTYSDDGTDGIGNCDPRYPGQDGRHCDNTCRADKYDPSQCGKTSSGEDDIFAD